MNIVTDQLAIVAGSVLTFTWNHNIRKKKNKEKWGGIDNLYESPRHGLLIYQNPLRYIRLKYSNEICTRPSVPAWSNDLFLLFTTGPRPTPDGMLGHRMVTPSPCPKFTGSHLNIWEKRGTVEVRSQEQLMTLLSPNLKFSTRNPASLSLLLVVCLRHAGDNRCLIFLATFHNWMRKETRKPVPLTSFVTNTRQLVCFSLQMEKGFWDGSTRWAWDERTTRWNWDEATLSN